MTVVAIDTDVNDSSTSVANDTASRDPGKFDLINVSFLFVVFVNNGQELLLKERP